MATNLALDERLLNQALLAVGLKTQKDTVTTAWKEFIQRRESEQLIAAFGTIDFDDHFTFNR